MQETKTVEEKLKEDFRDKGHFVREKKVLTKEEFMEEVIINNIEAILLSRQALSVQEI